MGLSVGLDIAITGLHASQLGVDVISNNIANAQTAGYSRQELRLEALVGSPTFASSDNLLQNPGRGVQAVDVRRVHDEFIAFRLRESLQTLGRYEAEANALTQAEVVLNEPGDNGLGAQFDQFWNGWRELSVAPELSTNRANLLAVADRLASQLQRSRGQLSQVQRDADGRVGILTDQINRAAEQVARLNLQIVQREAAGSSAPAERDKRDLLLDELAGAANVTVTELDNGAVNVVLGGRQMVFGDQAYLLTTVRDPANQNFLQVQWATDGVPADLTSGRLFGLISARDTHVQGTIDKLDTLASALITQVNTVHTASFGLDNTTGQAFFNGTDAATIVINPVLTAAPNKIGTAAAANLPGDASRALAIADLESALVMNAGTSSVGEFYASTVAGLGVAIGESRDFAENELVLADHLRTLQDSVAGVNLDEEMTNLLRFQRAFEAASRLINVIDEMLDTLINRTGLAGR